MGLWPIASDLDPAAIDERDRIAPAAGPVE
jgi:hypothetical protein